MKVGGWLGCGCVIVSLFAAGCGDDETSGGGGQGGSGGEATAGQGPGGSGGAGGAGGSDGGSGGEGGSTGPTEAIALVRGELFTDDMAAAKTLHDMIASGGETPAKAAGNFAHDPYLGTTLLGTTENEFLSFDRWSSDENMDAFYGNPDFQAAFMQLFATPPQLTTFLRSDFHQWGDLDAGDAATPHFAVVVRGRLADTPDLIRPEHDAVAEGGEAAAKALGDVAHVVYLGRTDEREALIVDVWTSSEAIEGFYGDPGFQAAVGALFEAPPTVGVYGSSDFHGW